jgi:hypothetical protein
VGGSGNPNYQLLFFGLCTGDVGLPEYRVRDIFGIHFSVPLFLIYTFSREGWNQYMHDLWVFFLLVYLPANLYAH